MKQENAPQKRMFMENCEIRVLQYEELERETFQIKEPTKYEIHWDGVKFEFLVSRKLNSRQAVVFGTGDVETAGKRFTFPLYSRATWAKDMPFNGIWYFDPTVYEGDCMLCWGYGTNQRWYLENIAEILRVILEKLKIAEDSVVFCGSSGGGFTSMMLAAMLRGKAAVMNPQLSAIDFYPHKVKKLQESVLKPGEDLIKERLNCIAWFKKIGYFPQLYIKQNTGSVHDLETQVMPFLRNISELAFDCENRVSFEFYNAEGGHNAMPSKEETMRWLQEKLEQPLWEVPLVKYTGYEILDGKLIFLLDTGSEIRNRGEMIGNGESVPGHTFAFRLLKGNDLVEEVNESPVPYGVFSCPAAGKYQVKYTVRNKNGARSYLAKGIAVSEEAARRIYSDAEKRLLQELEEECLKLQDQPSNTRYWIEGGELRFSVENFENLYERNEEIEEKSLAKEGAVAFAFYLMKGQETLEKIFYGPKPSCAFKCPPDGVYRIKYYVKHGERRTSFIVNDVKVSRADD